MLYLLAIIFISICGLISTRSKIVYIINFLLLFFVSTHFQAGNDILNLQSTYDSSYNGLDSSERSILFYAAFLWLNDLGFSFFQVRCIDFFIWGGSLFFFIWKFTRSHNFVISCSFLFPLLTFPSQMRNGIVAAFIYLGFCCLFLINNRKHGITLFILFAILAGCIHYIGFIYLLCLLGLVPFNRKKVLKYVIIAAFIITILFKAGMIASMVMRQNEYYADFYFSSNKYDASSFLFIILSIEIILNYFISNKAANLIACHRELYPTKSIELAQFAVRVNIIFLTFIPLVLISGTFFRIYQNLIILTLVCVANASLAFLNKKNRFDYKLLVILFYLLFSVFYVRWQGEFFTFFNSIRL